MKDPKKKIAEGNKKKVGIVVLYPFHNKDNDTYLYDVIFPKANKAFYAKPESIFVKLSKCFMRDR